MAKQKPKAAAGHGLSFSVRLDVAERRALAEAAKAEDRPLAYLARQFIRDALKAKGFLK
jgi:predicted transcriptional regulator